MAATGFHQLLVPEAMGGLWASTARSTRAVAHAISLIAAGDSSLALILSIEPVAMFVTGWLADFHVDEADPTWLQAVEHNAAKLAETRRHFPPGPATRPVSPPASGKPSRDRCGARERLYIPT